MYLLLILLVSVVVRALTPQQVAKDLKSITSPGTGVFLASDPNFANETTQRWTTYEPPTYIVSVKPLTRTDISKIIIYAQKNNIDFLGTGGGHGYTTSLRSCQNGIEIDLGNFSQVKVDAAANTVTVGGGSHFGNVTGPLYAVGKEVAVGADTCVGFHGAMLGGGSGPYSGLRGLTLDSLLSVDMVTGTGELVTASAQNNSNLFWGIRGAGMNFGIVTSSTLRIYDATNKGQAINADFIFPTSANGSLWSYIAGFSSNMPKQLWLSPGLAYNSTTNTSYILFNLIYIGPRSEANQYIQPLVNLKPSRQNITQVNYSQLEATTRFGIDPLSCIKGRQHSIYSINLYKIVVSTLINVTNYVNSKYNSNVGLRDSVFAFDRIPNAYINSIPDSSTAFPSRDALAYVHFDIPILNPADEAAANSLGSTVRQMLAATSGAHSSTGLDVYVNYAHGDEGEESWYGARKLTRLQGLKKQYDPKASFSHYNGLSQGY